MPISKPQAANHVPCPGKAAEGVVLFPKTCLYAKRSIPALLVQQSPDTGRQLHFTTPAHCRPGLRLLGRGIVQRPFQRPLDCRRRMTRQVHHAAPCKREALGRPTQVEMILRNPLLEHPLQSRAVGMEHCVPCKTIRFPSASKILVG